MPSASIPAALTIGSAVVSGVGAYQQGQAASASAGYNAKVAANNAQIATQNANLAGAAGNTNTAAAGAKTKAQISATLANQAGSGINVDSGSAVDVRESEAKLGMLTALNTRAQATQQAYNYQVGAASELGQESLDKANQSNSAISGDINAASTVLGGAGKASQFSTYLASTGPGAGLTSDDESISAWT